MNELALFAGAGGGILGGKLLGWRTVCAVEFDGHARNILMQRQNDGCLSAFPIWDDVRTFDGKPWRNHVDVVSGGFPCQDISSAGTGEGIGGARSGLWSEMARIVSEVRPRYVLVENSPMLTSRGLGRVLGDLASMGYDARWGVFSAGDVGARHERERLWIVADSQKIRRFSGTDEDGAFRKARGQGAQFRDEQLRRILSYAISEKDHTELKRNPDAMAAWVDRLERIGNGQVPAVVKLAWEHLAL